MAARTFSCSSRRLTDEQDTNVSTSTVASTVSGTGTSTTVTSSDKEAGIHRLPFKVLERYLCAHTTTNANAGVPEHHEALHRATAEQYPSLAGQSVSATQGRLLRMLARTMGVRRILELGCFTGQSALWLAEGALLGANRANAGASVQVVTCELDPQAAAMARAWIARAGLADQVQVWEGPAQTTLELLDASKPFDLIFIDANKGGYIQYLDTILSRNLLTEHGLIVADNVLFRGEAVRVASGEQAEDVSSGIDSLVTNAKPGVRRAATAMHAFNRYSAADTRIEVILLPLFDGLSLIQRRASLRE